MRRKLFRVGMAWRLLIALILALCLLSIGSSPVAALDTVSVGGYFEITYAPVEFSKTEINGSEVFYATVGAEAACTNDLPLTVSEARITGCVTATHQVSGTKVTLNPSYDVTISPFPNEEGETCSESVDVALQFPGGSQAGTYTVNGELIEAKVKVIIEWDVTSFLPESQAMGSVTYVALDDGGGGGGGWGDESTPGTIYISDIIDWQGIVTQSVEALSVDGKCTLAISEGTKALTKYAQPLRRISTFEEVSPPASPADTEVIGLTYDLSPDGANFDPPVDLTFVYSRSSIPEGVAEEDLVIAMWDVNAGKWVALDDCIVNTSTHTITAKVTHFTYFTALAYTKPAAFTVSALSITPQEVSIGEEVTISVSVANAGNLSSSYEVTLKIDNEVIETQEVTLAGGASDTVTFKIAEDATNTYSVNINGLSGSFVVKPAATPELEPEQTPTPTPTPESTPELIPAPIPMPTSPPAKPIDWLVLSGVIAGVVVVGLLIFFLSRRRSY